MEKPQKRQAVFVYLCGMVVLHAAFFWDARESVSKGYSDFTIYYCAGMMVRKGLGHDLYNNSVQYQIQREFAPHVAIRLNALPYNHPPFEALFFAPFTFLSYLHAFILWDLLNAGALLAGAFLLRGQVDKLKTCSQPLCMLATLAFFPIFLTLLQGQDSILLLLLYVLTFVCLKKNARALSGAWLALGLFKPQLVLPFILLWPMRGDKKILYGFLPTAAALALVSLALVGTTGLRLYPGYVLRLDANMAGGAIQPSDMPNLRGLIYVLTHGRIETASIAIAFSCVILLLAAWLCRARETTPDLFCSKFALAMVATVLVSYHCLGYDLSVLLLPIALIFQKLWHPGTLAPWARALMLPGIGLLFFSPLQEFLLLHGNRLALMGWAVLLLLGGIVAQIWFETASRALPSDKRFGEGTDSKSHLSSGTIA